VTSPPRPRGGFGFTIALASIAIALTILGVFVITGRLDPVRPSPAPTAVVECTEETTPLAPDLAGPACPTAILAVELAVAPVRLPIERIVIQPGPFYCDLIWPGAQTAMPCQGGSVQSGQFMRAWVGFVGSPKVAVVALGLDLPETVAAPSRPRPPWQTTVVTVAVPPDGWLMP